MSFLNNGEYIIVNKATRQALDGNHTAASQLSYQHPRIFVSAQQNGYQVPNHKWIVERQPNGTYLLKTRFTNQEMALDGNTNVPNTVGAHPAPFLYTPTPSAPNHQWYLKPTGEYNTFLIVNASNGKALDGNTGGTSHHDFSHPTPFLYQETPTAPNHHWIFEPVAATLPDGKYLIVNKATGQALDFNHRAAQQISHGHPRIFTYSPTQHAPNHQWTVRSVGNGEYLLIASEGNSELALDGNMSVPQHAPSHPAPFLYAVTPSAPNHRWRLEAVPHQPNTFLIVNVSNGKALDGNTSGAPQLSMAHPTPFLWDKSPFAPNHQWEFRFAGSSTPSYPTYNPTPVPTYTPPPTQHYSTPNVSVTVTPNVGGMLGGLMNSFNASFNQPHQHHQHHQPQPHVHITPSPIQPTFGGSAMDPSAFQVLLQSIKRESFESGRTNVINTAANHNHFTCDQLSQIVKMLSFAGERENACRVIAPKVVDRQNSYVVLSALTFQGEKDKVSKFFM